MATILSPEQQAALTGPEKNNLEDIRTNTRWFSLTAKSQYFKLREMIVNWEKADEKAYADKQKHRASILLSYSKEITLPPTRLWWETYYGTADLLAKKAYEMCMKYGDPVLKVDSARNYLRHLNEVGSPDYILKRELEQQLPDYKEDSDESFAKKLDTLFPPVFSLRFLPASSMGDPSIYLYKKSTHPLAEIIHLANKEFDYYTGRPTADLDKIIKVLSDYKVDTLNAKTEKQIIALLNIGRIRHEICDHIIKQGKAKEVIGENTLLLAWMKTPKSYVAGYRFLKETTNDTQSFAKLKVAAREKDTQSLLGLGRNRG